MPKQRKKYFAVCIGREGPRIYATWDECRINTARWPGAIHKVFSSRVKAGQWLQVMGQPSYDQPQLNIPRKAGSCRKDKPSQLRRSIESKSTACPTVVRSVSNNEPDSGASANGSVMLSPEQERVLRMVREGKNVFFTGSAGTGKSVLLREIIKTLGGASPTLAITASTGIASVNIGGTTVHSWAGIGLGQEPAKNFAGKFLKQSMFAPIVSRWRSVQTLIIDEISMIDGDLFDKLETIGRIVRNSDAPFGGIQLVLSGDFCQLPPVPGRCESGIVSPKFAFEAQSWDRCVGAPVHLTRVFRQKDQDFVDMLNAMRLGQLNNRIIEEFNKLSRPVVYDDGIEPTEIYATRREVDSANSSRLQQLPGLPHMFQAQDTPGYNSKNERISGDQMDRTLERLLAAKTISLKVGAQVMLIKNLVQGELVNGSVGKVVSFSTRQEAEKDHVDIAKADESSAIPPHLMKGEKDGPGLPVVRFTSGKGILICPVTFTVNNAQGDVEASREQIPLILAWALSCHKSQGLTLSRTKVDLGRTFEKGQAYVALSRATSMETLQVLHFHPSKVQAHPKVLEWYFGTRDNAIEDEMDNEEAIASYCAFGD